MQTPGFSLSLGPFLEDVRAKTRVAAEGALVGTSSQGKPEGAESPRSYQVLFRSRWKVEPPQCWSLNLKPQRTWVLIRREGSQAWGRLVLLHQHPN